MLLGAGYGQKTIVIYTSTAVNNMTKMRPMAQLKLELFHVLNTSYHVQFDLALWAKVKVDITIGYFVYGFLSVGQSI